MATDEVDESEESERSSGRDARNASAANERNARLRRQLSILMLLLSGRARRFWEFEQFYEGRHQKTLARDLAAWVEASNGKIKTGTDGHGKWWRLDHDKTRAEHTEVQFKMCSKCPTEIGLQPVENFGKVTSSPDGHRGICKRCMNEAKRDWYHRNSEIVKKYRKRQLRSSKMSKRRAREL